MLGDQRSLLPFVRRSSAHVAHEMHDRVAVGDVGVELVEHIAAKVLEVLLHLHRDVMPREIMDELIPVSPELVGNGERPLSPWLPAAHRARSCHVSATRNTADMPEGLLQPSACYNGSVSTAK